jgi:hypothetical protein
VIYDFCAARGAQLPRAFLGDGDDDETRERSWRGTLVRDEYKAHESVIDAVPGRIAAGCLAHARRKFGELLLDGATNAVAPEALKRIAAICRVERELAQRTPDERLALRGSATRPLREELRTWLAFERRRVPDGSAVAKAIALPPAALDRADAPPARRQRAGGQQPPREPRASMGLGTQGLVVRRQRTGWQARCGRHEPGAVGQAPPA